MRFSAVAICEERIGDEDSIIRVHHRAFPGLLEGRLVNELRQSRRLKVSFIATSDDQIVGHVAFSPVTVGVSDRGVGLAPLAVLPEFQRQGIGAALVKHGIEECRQRGIGFVVVLGDPSFYRRFGFQPTSHWQLSDEYGGGEAFQALELQSGTVPKGGGLVRYAPEFSIFES